MHDVVTFPNWYFCWASPEGEGFGYIVVVVGATTVRKLRRADEGFKLPSFKPSYIPYCDLEFAGPWNLVGASGVTGKERFRVPPVAIHRECNGET